MSEYGCACRTTWLADIGGGEKPVDAMTAAMASGMGIQVKLGQMSKSPLRPIRIPGVCYGRGLVALREICEVCGDFTRVEELRGRDE